MHAAGCVSSSACKQVQCTAQVMSAPQLCDADADFARTG